MNVVLLHAIGRTRLSMRRLAARLGKEGYRAHCIGYPSTRKPMRELADIILDKLAGRDLLDGEFDFVGHSMGGVMLRALFSRRPDLRVRRAVLLGAPINGSVIADHAGMLASLYYGPAFADLRTSSVSELPAIPAPTGMIAGTRTLWVHPGLHYLRRLAPGEPSDSAVLLRETRADWLHEHTTVDVAHPALPANRRVLDLATRYLTTGTFGAR